MADINLHDGDEIELYYNNKEYDHIKYFLFDGDTPINLNDGDFAKIQIQLTPEYPLVSSTSRGEKENEIRNYTNPKILVGSGRYAATLYVFDENKKIKHMIDYVINVTRE